MTTEEENKILNARLHFLKIDRDNLATKCIILEADNMLLQERLQITLALVKSECAEKVSDGNKETTTPISSTTERSNSNGATYNQHS